MSDLTEVLPVAGRFTVICKCGGMVITFTGVGAFDLAGWRNAECVERAGVMIHMAQKGSAL